MDFLVFGLLIGLTHSWLIQEEIREGGDSCDEWTLCSFTWYHSPTEQAQKTYQMNLYLIFSKQPVYTIISNQVLN